MSENTHATAAQDLIRKGDTWAETADGRHIATHIKAQVEATLALAYEQRTANLIALYSMDDGARQGMVDGAGLHSGNWVDVTKQIRDRLGLA